ncbi:MAG TPA: GNAT family N-acetyltransferase [Rhizomicrobium sp.]
MSGLAIRRARAGDEATVLELLHELAVYEKIAHRFRLTREIITRDFFGSEPRCFCELGFLGAEPVGVMTWYRTYASFSAACGIFLEDLFVRQSHRGRGFGKMLLAHLAAQAVSDDARYIDWFVLDWNTPSIAFYERLRAEQAKGWLSYRLSGDALEQLGRG